MIIPYISRHTKNENESLSALFTILRQGASHILYIFMPTDEMIAKHLTVSLTDQQILCKCNKADTLSRNTKEQ